MKNFYFKGILLLFFNLIFINFCFAQWDIVDIGSTAQLYDVHFIDKDTGWIAADNVVYKTVDAGTNWTAYNAAVSDTRYYGIYFKDLSNGWAVGKKKTSSTAGRVHFTTDGGETWQVYFTSGSLPWWSVAFTEDGNYGAMVGQEGQALYTPDGGITWFNRTLPSGSAGIIKDVTFYDGLTGVAVGYDAGQGVIMKTTDGGSSWTNIVTNLEGQLNSVSFSNFLEGIAVGSAGKIYKTSDGGDTWVPKESNTANTLNGVKYYDENRIIAVGNSGTIVGSSDNGETWEIEDAGTTFTLRNVDKSSLATTFAVGPVGTVVKDNCVQSGTITFTDNTAPPFIAPELTTESKVYFYYNVEDNENTPPLCTTVEEFVFYNGELVKMGARYLGNGLLQMWLDFTFEQDQLNLTISIPDALTEDGISINFDETTRPPDFNVNLGLRPDVKESISLFAGSSIGIDLIEAGVGIGPATLALAKQTVSGSGGMGLKFQNDLLGNRIITRSFEFGAGLSAEFPAINTPLSSVIGTPKASIALKGLKGQSMKFSDNSDTTKKARAAYLLETFGIGGIPLSPFAGVYIIALKNALVALNPDVSSLYSTYHYSDIKGASAEGGLSLDFNFKFLGTDYNFLEASTNASISANIEDFVNGKREFNMNYARNFNVSALDFKVLNNAVDFGKQISYEVGGKIGLSGTYNNLNNQIETLALSFNGSASPQIPILQVSKLTDYKFIIPESVISSNSAFDNIIGVASDLLTVANSNKTFNTGLDNFTNSLDIIYEDNPSTLGSFDDHNLLEVIETNSIGFKETVGIDLSLAIGVGAGISLGLEYSYISESEFLESQYIVANDTILPTIKNLRNFDDLTTLNSEITDLFEGTTLLLDGAFDELITTVEEPIQDGVDFIIEIGDSTVELAGNIVSDGEKWILRWLDPSYTSSFNRGPLFQTDVGQIYVSRVSSELSETNSTTNNSSTLYIVSNNLNASLIDIDETPVNTFDPVNLSLTIDQDKIDELGFTDTEKSLAKLYRFDEATISWIEIDGDTNANLDIVETQITESGNYAIGINYNTASDVTAPEIPDFYPTEGSVIPSIDEHWAELFEPLTGVGLDLSQTTIKIDDVEVPILWDPVNERILYTPENALADGAHTFEVIVKDLNGNTNSIFSNYTVDSSLSIDDISDIDKFKIYPNPAQDILNVKGNLSILDSLEIYNLNGQLVKSTTNNFERIDIQELTPGLYFARISTNNAHRVIKVIKQ